MAISFSYTAKSFSYVAKTYSYVAKTYSYKILRNNIALNSKATYINMCNEIKNLMENSWR